MSNYKYNIHHFLLLIFFSFIKTQTGNIDYNKYTFDSSPNDLVWCGQNNEYVFVITNKNTVYKSSDKGMNWIKLSETFSNVAKDELSNNQKEEGLVTQIIKSPADKTLLIFLGTKGINWIGENCANNIYVLNHGRRIQEFIFHPTERNWGLASALTSCEDFPKEPCKIYKAIFVTFDLGQNWKPIKSYVVQFNWGIVEKEQIDKGVPKERILLTYEPRGTGHQQDLGWNYKVDLVYSDDFFKTTILLVSKGNKFLLTNHYLFVATVSDQETQEVFLLGSKSTHFKYDFQLIETNLKTLYEHSYTFLDSTFHSVFLLINHFGENSIYGNIYTSGPRGLHYSLSLKHAVRISDDLCDFEKVNSVEGVYIANMISGKFMKMYYKEMQVHQQSLNKMGKSKKKSNEKKGSHSKSNREYTDYIKTQITFNRGGDWQRLKAPERDSNGKKYNCGNYCFLNLFGVTSNYPPFYSVSSAAGIIIGNGNVGHYLSKNVSTFLSRDGGLNWKEVRKGSHIYEIGDDGGIIVMASNTKPTNKIYYSFDEGYSWEEFNIAVRNFMIRNIIIEPSSKSHNFIVYGEVSNKGEKKGLAVGVSFENVYPQCRNPDKPGTPDSDYEIWSPSDGRAGQDCLLGHKIEMIRRKPNTKCLNTLNFERKITKSNCPCTEMDYQCDIGYARNEPGAICQKIGGEEEQQQKVSIHEPPINCNGTYKISKGYRKIPGDTCINGLNFDPIIVPCPKKFFLAGTGLYIFIIFLIIFGIFIYLVKSGYLDFSLDFDITGISNLYDKIANSFNNYNYQKPSQKNSYNNIKVEENDDNTLFEDNSNNK